jgi:hypothetical protein
MALALPENSLAQGDEVASAENDGEREYCPPLASPGQRVRHPNGALATFASIGRDLSFAFTSRAQDASQTSPLVQNRAGLFSL